MSNNTSDTSRRRSLPSKVGRVVQRSSIATQRSQPSASPPSTNNGVSANTNGSKPRKCYVLGTMRHCGSIYEEMARQLMATGRWTRLQVRQRASTKQLYVDNGSGIETDLIHTEMHLLLGEKLPVERLLSYRRALCTRSQKLQERRGSSTSVASSGTGARRTTYQPQGPSVRIPMGDGSDGEDRVVDFIENTRCITLKTSMVDTLLRHHRNSWETLGTYLPMSFQLVPRKQTTRDDRESFLAEARRTRKESAGVAGAEAPLWIAKSSSGCHGDNMEIFAGTLEGANALLAFVDKQKQPYPWVAQQYISRPLLYHKRKFDIRCWILVLRYPFQVYVHNDLVMRTSSVPYDTSTATTNEGEDRLAHITNHCVQSTGQDYSKFEEGNELWREHLDGLIRYKARKLTERRHKLGLATDLPGFPTMRNTITPQINKIVVDTMQAMQPELPEEPHPPPTYSFQVFGYDFLIDDSLNVWLLEINGAPGGAERLLPSIMRDTIELAVEPHFPGSFVRTASDSPNAYTRVYPE